MVFNYGFWLYSMMGGWSTWQWVVLDSSQFFWSFDTPETPGSVSVVFADNQSENEIWNRLKQFLPVWGWVLPSLSPLMDAKGGLISEGILTLVPFPTKCAPNLAPEQKIWISCLLKRAGNSNFLLGQILVSFVGNVSKVKIPSEIKPPLEIVFFCQIWLRVSPKFQVDVWNQYF